MDGDPRVEPQLDSFSLTFPLPFRVGFIITLAVWGWGLNLHGLQLARIDLPALIRYPGRTSPAALSHHLSTYRFATVLSALLGLCLALFWLLTLRDPRRVVDHGWLPLAYLLALAALFAVPLRNLPGQGRRRFLVTLRRVSVGGLAGARDGKFGDILLADVLTSYAKVLGDVFVTACMFASPGGSATDRPNRDCGGVVVVPLLMAVPSLIRLRQCVIEYLRVRDANSSRHHEESTNGWGGQHLANALKYATALPVIVTSSMQRSAEAAGDASAGPGLYRAWLLAVTVNSLYSFYWDVTKDWDLTLFAPSSTAKMLRAPASSHHQPWGLRPRLAFRLPSLYYGVVLLDLLLRFTWSMKLSPHLDRFSGWEVGIFVVELLEVFRRWVWIFFRAETEWIRTTSSPVLGLDDVLLGDYREADGDEEDGEDF
ncbi:exs [Cordyceps fumosorosea ARSEF 2679]|uniref:Exs n=1 Tax=Cordyceps fumosorosea (strain ARSEF 2679) TaxID=1081104 RepID=A0A168ENP8_CORFA|nr:exs [Cordyceps fumosorosea ARSEF 2679]OAA74033.1 exs [Cordyceps fumosorosea ARSEF 2679]